MTVWRFVAQSVLLVNYPPGDTASPVPFLEDTGFLFLGE